MRNFWPDGESVAASETLDQTSARDYNHLNGGDSPSPMSFEGISEE